jgi:hypothetical protein
LITRSEQPFLSCLTFSTWRYYHLAITTNQIYQYDEYHGKLTITNFDDSIKIISSNGFIIIQKKDGSLYRYNALNQEIKRIVCDPVDILYDGCAKLTNGSIACFENDHTSYGKHFNSHIISLSNKNIRGAMLSQGIIGTKSYSPQILVLIDTHVYEIKRDGEIKLIQENVKNIGSGYFII